MADMKTPAGANGRGCGSHDLKSGSREFKQALNVLQAPHRLTLTLLAAARRAGRVDGFGDELRVAIIPMAQVPDLLRAFVDAEAFT